MRNLRTSARRDGDDWVIDGHKMWIGNGGIANVHVVNATVDPELGHSGQALFIVPGGTPGLELVRKLDKLGCRASHTAELRFDDCASRPTTCSAATPSSRRLEPCASGRARGPRPRLGDARRVRADAADGRGAGARHRPRGARVRRDYASEREAFGGPILDNQGVSFPLADLAADLDAARLLTWRASWMAANSVPFQHAEGSMSKLKASEVAVRVSEQAIQTAAAGATSATTRWRSGTATRSSTRSSRARARSSGW